MQVIPNDGYITSPGTERSDRYIKRSNASDQTSQLSMPDKLLSLPSSHVASKSEIAPSKKPRYIMENKLTVLKDESEDIVYKLNNLSVSATKERGELEQTLFFLQNRIDEIGRELLSSREMETSSVESSRSVTPAVGSESLNYIHGASYSQNAPIVSGERKDISCPPMTSKRNSLIGSLHEQTDSYATLARPTSPSWLHIGLDDLPAKILEEYNRTTDSVILEAETDVPHGYVNFTFPRCVRGVSRCLFSDRIINDLRRLDPALPVPVDKVEALLQDGRCVALIGVSGCGKTRTCYDLCRSGKQFGVYFDWALHMDLNRFKSDLVMITSQFQSLSREEFSKRSLNIVKKIVVCRLLVLETLISAFGETFKPQMFFELQQYANSETSLIAKVASVLSRLRKPKDTIALDQLYATLKKWSVNYKICLIFDEAQLMLEVQKGCYPSSKDSSKYENGHYVEPRSFFSLMAHFVIQERLMTVWSGTHLRLGDVALLASSVASKQEQIPHVFTNFNFLTSKLIKKLLDLWLRTDSETLKLKIARKLAGRPRFLCSFIEDLYGHTYESDLELSRIFNKFYQSITIDRYSDFSLVKYISACEGKTMKEFAPEKNSEFNPDHLIMDRIIDLLYDYFLLDMRRSPKLGDKWYDGLVSTAIIMIGNDSDGRVCEHAVADSAVHHFRSRNRDVLVEKILRGTSFTDGDEASRGKAVERICAIRLREGFFLREEFEHYLPISVQKLIEDGVLLTPEGLVDCRTNDLERSDWLRRSFLNPSATHVVFPDARLGGADLVYACFSFHIKTKWSDVNSWDLKLSIAECKRNEATMDATLKEDDELAKRAQNTPWVRICIELPLSGKLEKMRRLNKLNSGNELVTHDGNITTITVDMYSKFTRSFFGSDVMKEVERLRTQHKAWHERQRTL